MIELEKLYDCMDSHLREPPPDWAGFAQGFKSIFKAEMVLYRAVFDADPNAAERFEIIATSDQPTIDKYMKMEIYKMHHIPETAMAPLEPVRRTDSFTDEEYRNIGPLTDFLIEHGMFYLMNVPAIMPDGSFVCVHTWRREGEPDFSDIEKQRLALMMRHLLAIVGETELGETEPDAEVVTFGKKYGLTPTETEILALLIDGHSLRSIADKGDRSYGTVRWHVQNILAKCQVKTQKNLLTEFYQLVKH